MNPLPRNQAATAAAAMVLVACSTAHAHGGWNGVPMLVGTVATPVATVLFVVQLVVANVTRRRAIRRWAGIVTGVGAILCLGWLVYWVDQEAHLSGWHGIHYSGDRFYVVVGGFAAALAAIAEAGWLIVHKTRPAEERS